jgi:hypothetical protein
VLLLPQTLCRSGEAVNNHVTDEVRLMLKELWEHIKEEIRLQRFGRKGISNADA